MTAGTLRIDGVRCPCGCADLTIVAPGHEPERHDLLGLLERPTPLRGWCCLEHALEPLREAERPRCAKCGAHGELATFDGEGNRFCNLVCAGVAA